MKSEWYTMIEDERGTLRLEFARGRAFLHLTLKQAMAGMRAAKDIFPDVLRLLRGIGYRHAHVIIPEGDDALYRFEKFFGFSELRRRGGHILMRRET